MLMVMSTLDIKELLKIMGEKEKEKKKGDFMKSKCCYL